MERKDSQSNIRLYVLASLLGLALVVYIGVLYDIQINQHDYYLAKSIRTITQEETVEASGASSPTAAAGRWCPAARPTT